MRPPGVTSSKTTLDLYNPDDYPQNKLKRMVNEDDVDMFLRENIPQQVATATKVIVTELNQDQSTPSRFLILASWLPIVKLSYWLDPVSLPLFIGLGKLTPLFCLAFLEAPTQTNCCPYNQWSQSKWKGCIQTRRTDNWQLRHGCELSVFPSLHDIFHY